MVRYDGRRKATMQMIFCPRCGMETQQSHAYCHSCGAPLPAGNRATPQRARGTRFLRTAGGSDMRFAAFAVGGLVAMLILAEVVRAVVVIMLPLVIVMIIVFWARERRRRYY